MLQCSKALSTKNLRELNLRGITTWQNYIETLRIFFSITIIVIITFITKSQFSFFQHFRIRNCFLVHVIVSWNYIGIVQFIYLFLLEKITLTSVFIYSTCHFSNHSIFWIWNNRLEIIGFNNSNQIRKLLRHAPCVVYTLNLYGYKKKLLYILYFRLFLSHRKFVCCFTHKKNKSSKKSFVSFLFISIFATNMYNRKPHKLSFCAFQSIYPT